MLPFFLVADRFVDLAKQQKRANQGSLPPPALLSQAIAAGVTLQVSAGSQRCLGSESSTTRKTTGDDGPSANKREAASNRRVNAKSRKSNEMDRRKVDAAKARDNTQPTQQGDDAPGKQSGQVPGSQKSKIKPKQQDCPNGKSLSSGKQPPRASGKSPGQKDKKKK